jgi:hypothetical protein
MRIITSAHYFRKACTDHYSPSQSRDWNIEFQTLWESVSYINRPGATAADFEPLIDLVKEFHHVARHLVARRCKEIAQRMQPANKLSTVKPVDEDNTQHTVAEGVCSSAAALVEATECPVQGFRRVFAFGNIVVRQWADAGQAKAYLRCLTAVLETPLSTLSVPLTVGIT